MKNGDKIKTDASIITDGFNDPTEHVKIIGRGDKTGVTPMSTGIYLQQVGRGMRTKPLKWYNRPLGPYYTVGESLIYALLLLIGGILTVAVWLS